MKGIFMDAFLMASGFALWAAIALSTVGMLFWIEKNNGWMATFCMGCVGAILQYAVGINVIGYISSNPISIVYGVLGYLAIGALWAIAKWWFFVSGERRKYDEFKSYWMTRYNICDNVIPENLKDQFMLDLPKSYEPDRFVLMPMPAYYKEAIFVWIAYWPWSCLWTLINDPVRRACSFTYEYITGLLERISKNAWAGTERDFLKKGK